MIDTAFRYAQITIGKYMEVELKRHNITQTPLVVVFREVSESFLYQLYLLSENTNQLSRIKDKIKSSEK